MLWLARPPYLRWFAAGAILVAALSWDLSKRQTEPYPFASQTITRGEHLNDGNVEWRDMPAGLFPILDLADASARVDIVDGTPIFEAVVSRSAPLPSGWWSIPIDLPVGTPEGSAVRVLAPDGQAITGIIVRPAMRDTFGSVEAGAVAFPPQHADTVARMVAGGGLVVLVEQ
ncbi:MAG: SAF domain-containing protein [Actinomycetia bacterium]|nr:SAF domain-containing protein [Actinomycetes bacterium]